MIIKVYGKKFTKKNSSHIARAIFAKFMCNEKVPKYVDIGYGRSGVLTFEMFKSIRRMSYIDIFKMSTSFINKLYTSS